MRSGNDRLYSMILFSSFVLRTHTQMELSETYILFSNFRWIDFWLIRIELSNVHELITVADSLSESNNNNQNNND